MCQRFAYTLPPAAMGEVFGVSVTVNLQPRWNIAPTQPVSVIWEGPGGGRRHDLMRWGLVPAWAREPGRGAPLTNARSETAGEKPAFREALQHRRCLVPADAWYEWSDAGGWKQPFRMAFADGRAFAFAGLFERWQGRDGERIESCCILTTAASPALAPLHHRMPVILAADAQARWLAAPDPELLTPWQGEPIEAVAIDRRIGPVRAEGPDLVRPVAVPETLAARLAGRPAPPPAQGELF